MAPVLVAVPDILHLAVNRRIDVIEFLELINDQREVAGGRQLHQVLEQVLELGESAIQPDTQLAFDFFLELVTNQYLTFARHKQVQGIFLQPDGSFQQTGFPDAAATYHHSHPGLHLRPLPDGAKQFQFIFPVIKSHGKIILLQPPLL